MSTHEYTLVHISTHQYTSVHIRTVNISDLSADLSAGPARDGEEVDYLDRLVYVSSRQPYLGWNKGSQALKEYLSRRIECTTQISATSQCKQNDSKCVGGAKAADNVTSFCQQSSYQTKPYTICLVKFPHPHPMGVSLI